MSRPFMNGWRRGFVFLSVLLGGYLYYTVVLIPDNHTLSVWTPERLSAEDSVAVAQRDGRAGDVERFRHEAGNAQLVIDNDEHVHLLTGAWIWAVALAILYAFGASIAWVRRGFRRPTIEAEIIDD